MLERRGRALQVWMTAGGIQLSISAANQIVVKGTFGRLYAGYGFSDKYIAGGNINNFNSKCRLSVVGLANNISLHNFVTEDIVERRMKRVRTDIPTS